MPKRLAMTVDGRLTYCTADDEHIGRGRCNHIAHQRMGEDPQDFLDRANEIQKGFESKDGRIKVRESYLRVLQDASSEAGEFIGDDSSTPGASSEEMDELSLRCACNVIDILNDNPTDEEISVIKKSAALIKIEVIKSRQIPDPSIFVDDRHPTVRAELAKQGYCLDELANDPDVAVRSIAMFKSGKPYKGWVDQYHLDVIDGGSARVSKNGRYLFTAPIYAPSRIKTFEPLDVSSDCDENEVSAFKKAMYDHLYTRTILNEQTYREPSYKKIGDSNVSSGDYYVDPAHILEDHFIEEIDLDNILCRWDGGWCGTYTDFENCPEQSQMVVNGSSMVCEIGYGALAKIDANNSTR